MYKKSIIYILNVWCLRSNINIYNYDGLFFFQYTKVYREAHLLASHLCNSRIDTSESNGDICHTPQQQKTSSIYHRRVSYFDPWQRRPPRINTPDHSKSSAHVWHANNSETFPRSERTRNTCRLLQSPAILDLHLLAQVWRRRNATCEQPLSTVATDFPCAVKSGGRGKADPG